MSAISQPRNGEQRLYVKLDAWHTFDLPLLRRAFPDTPWIFLYRNPIEVMVSAMKAPGMHLVPNLIDINIPGIEPAAAQHMPQPEYIARVLAAVLRCALQHLVPLGGKAFDYLRLPDVVFTDVAAHFQLTLGADQIAAMHAKTAFDAKTPQLFFEPDALIKQQQATADARALCAELLDPLYKQLQ